MYVLDPKLQDGKKLPKWVPRARCGQFLGISPDHASSIGLIRNLTTGKISCQFHVVYDDWFSSVPNFNNPDDERDLGINIKDLLDMKGGTREYYLDDEFDETGFPVRMPDIHDEWLTPSEREMILLRKDKDILARPRVPMNIPTEAQAPTIVTPPGSPRAPSPVQGAPTLPEFPPDSLEEVPFYSVFTCPPTTGP